MASIVLKRGVEGRVKRLREAHKLTKAEICVRARLTPTQYSWLEPPNIRRRYGKGSGARVPVEWVQRLAAVLGTTPGYIVAGDVSHLGIVAPNNPLAGMVKELERERAMTATITRKFQRLLDKTQDALEQETREHLETREELRAEIESQHDNVEYLRELLDNDKTGTEFLDLLLGAVERMEQGFRARPAPAAIPNTPEWNEDRRLPAGAVQNEMAGA